MLIVKFFLSNRNDLPKLKPSTTNMPILLDSKKMYELDEVSSVSTEKSSSIVEVYGSPLDIVIELSEEVSELPDKVVQTPATGQAKIIMDISSQNVAEEMYVGHLPYSIIDSRYHLFALKSFDHPNVYLEMIVCINSLYKWVLPLLMVHINIVKTDILRYGGPSYK